MVAIPTYLYLGGSHLNGQANSGTVAQPGDRGRFWTNQLASARLMQSVPFSGADYAPWWDGQAGTQRTITGATSTTVTVSGTPWTPGDEVGKTVIIDTGVGQPVGGVPQQRTVTANTANELTVSAAWLTNPTNGKLHINDGQWTFYQHISGRDVFTAAGPVRDNLGTNGDNWYANDQGGFGASTMLMQLLKDRHPTAPWFRCFKWAFPGGMAAWGDSGSALWSGFVTDWSEALAAYGADTPLHRGVIIDASIDDIVIQNNGFLGHLFAFVTNIRALLGVADLPVFIVVHAAGLYSNPTPGQGGSVVVQNGLTIPYASIIRGYCAAARGLITNLNLVDMEGAEFAVDNIGESIGFLPTILPGTISTNPTAYTTAEHLVLGQKIYNEIARFYDPGPTLPVGGGIPTFVLIGDSQAQGLISPQYAILGGQASLLGPVPLASVMGTQLIWDGADEGIEPYDLAMNSNTLGAVTPLYYGPDATFLRRLGLDFPDGVLLLKMAVGGASMTIEGSSGNTFDPVALQHWTTLADHWNKARLASVRDLSLVPDVLGVAVLLGDNDTDTDLEAAAFVSKLPAFVTSLRELFTTRTTGGDLPIAWHLPPKHLDEGGQSVFGINSARRTVRAGLVAYASTDDAFKVANEAGLELLRAQWTIALPDNVHYGGEANHEIGLRLADLILSTSAAEPGAIGGGTDVPGADLIVENGTGLPDADSYLSLVEAETFADSRGGPAEWVAGTTAEKNSWLRQAAAPGIDLMFGMRWTGQVMSTSQALLWPRWGAWDRTRGRGVLANTVPIAVKRCQFEFALALSKGIDPLKIIDPSMDRSTFAISTTDRLPGGFEESRTYESGGPALALAVITRMQLFAGPLLEDVSEVRLA